MGGTLNKQSAQQRRYLAPVPDAEQAALPGTLTLPPFTARHFHFAHIGTRRTGVYVRVTGTRSLPASLANTVIQLATTLFASPSRRPHTRACFHLLPCRWHTFCRVALTPAQRLLRSTYTPFFATPASRLSGEPSAVFLPLRPLRTRL